MKLEEKYLIKFLDNNKFKSPVAQFVETLQSFYTPTYRHAHPFILQWNITPKCNLRCKHCYYAEHPEIYTNTIESSLERKLQIVDEIADLNIFHVIISGGEALICEGFFEVLKKLKSKHISIYLHSNGIIIDKNLAQKLSSIFTPEVDTIQISLDGLEEAHNKTRGIGTFKKAIDAIKNLVEVKIPVCVNFTATKQNVKDILPTYTLASELGVQKFSLLKFVPCSKEQEKLTLSFEELLNVSCNLVDAENPKTFVEVATFKLNDFIQRNLATDFILNRSKEFNNLISSNSISCHKHGQLFITFEGDVFACRDAYVCKTLSLGNINDSSLIELWENRTNNELFKERTPEELGCKNCQFIGICKAWCPIKSYEIYQDINKTCLYCKVLRSQCFNP